MDEIDVKRLIEAARLRSEAEQDDQMAEERAEDNPMFSDYLRRRAAHKRFLANNRDGGLGQ
jgi:hypothetical protein